MIVRYRRSRQAVCCVIEGQGYVSACADDAALALNISGTIVWDWLKDGRTMAEMEAALRGTFGDSPCACEDLRQFLEELGRFGLVSAESADAPSEPIHVPAHRRGGYARPAAQPMERSEAYAFV